jgi:hypothetical protein
MQTRRSRHHRHAHSLSNGALFCTYYNKIGSTLTDLALLLKKNKVTLIGTAEFGNLKQAQILELDKNTLSQYTDKAKKFADTCKAGVRLKRNKTRSKK